MARPTGSPNAPRARAIKTLEERFPELAEGGLLFKMAEQAVLAEQELNDRAAQENGEPINLIERQTVQGMYEKVTKYVLPQLRATEVNLSGADGGAITVRFARSEEGLRLAANLGVAFPPAAVVGLLFVDTIKAFLFGLWPVVCAWR